MPLINSGGVRQAPWAEGQNVRHLEPMGFIKFDLLGLSTLKMMEVQSTIFLSAITVSKSLICTDPRLLRSICTQIF